MTEGGSAVVARIIDVQLRRIYDEPRGDDGIRVLVDGRWPRGVSRERAELDEWCTAVAPSDELRKWYGHVSEKFEEFGFRYCVELRDGGRAAALRHLKDMAARDRLTLLTGTKQLEISHAVVLAEEIHAAGR
jgi:uncharacterized protein YeaO (DUF488 family)